MLRLSAFVQSPAFLRTHRAPCIAPRKVYSRKPTTTTRNRRATFRASPTAQFSGNVEDLPAEKIPATPQEIPDHWRRPGVYGIYSTDKRLHYVAAVNNVADAIAGHMNYIPDKERLFAVRMITVDSVEEGPLSALAENWVMAHSTHLEVPPGNSDAAPEWREEPRIPEENVYFLEGCPPEFVSSEIKAILRDYKLVLFMKGTRAQPLCGFSAAVVETLEKAAGPNFVCVDCLDEERNPGLRQGIKEYSKWPTIPQLYVNGDFVGGCDIIKSMEESGELKTLIEGVLSPV